ncbi:hypothetical protein JW979_12700 [bacterium]|nr:hypothetical protein [candidate division CSSED10-310 bacterium]
MGKNAEYKLYETPEIISGEEHWLVVRSDGFKFYIDSAFRHALLNYRSSTFFETLGKLGVQHDEIPIIIKMLKGAGLINE